MHVTEKVSRMRYSQMANNYHSKAQLAIQRHDAVHVYDQSSV